MAEGAREVLLIEDNLSLATVFSTQLRNAGIEVQTCHLAADAIEYLVQHHYALVLLDLQLPDRDGLELLSDIRQRGIDTSVIVVTSDASTARVVEALRIGAQDYLVKPVTSDRLIVTVRNILELTSLKRQVKAESGRSTFEGFVGSSRQMQAVYSAIENIAQSKATVFITGESGTGKELCAEAIHRRSPRSKKPFIAINCGAIPKDLIETELFGHVKGAFTGAISDRDGAVSLSDGGTLFLDEICEMDVALQTKLLRFLQTGSLQRVGGQKTEAVDVRVICATNRNPVAEVRNGRFREDLYYRLNVIPIHLPPLREREKDSILIAEALLEKISSEEGKQFFRFSPDAIEAILNYSWPGNVRELENVIRRVIVFNNGPAIKAEMLPEPIFSSGSTSPLHKEPEMLTADEQTDPISAGGRSDSDDWVPRDMSLAELEREIIEAAIQRNNSNVTEAAKQLSVSPSTLYRKRAPWAKDQ
jgi:two-component system repressor protein LuxO